jgi:hypothetical protein
MNPTTDDIADSVPDPGPRRDRAWEYNQFLAAESEALSQKIESEVAELQEKQREERDELVQRHRRQREALTYKHRLLRESLPAGIREHWAERKRAMELSPDEKAQAKLRDKEARQRADAPAKAKQNHLLMADTPEGMIEELETRIAGLLKNRKMKGVADAINRMQRTIAELGGTPRQDSAATTKVVAEAPNEAEMDRLLNAETHPEDLSRPDEQTE